MFVVTFIGHRTQSTSHSSTRFGQSPVEDTRHARLGLSRSDQNSKREREEFDLPFRASSFSFPFVIKSLNLVARGIVLIFISAISIFVRLNCANTAIARRDIRSSPNGMSNIWNDEVSPMSNPTMFSLSFVSSMKTSRTRRDQRRSIDAVHFVRKHSHLDRFPLENIEEQSLMMIDPFQLTMIFF